MTGQTLLNYMELLNAELQLQAGEPDVVKAMLALNIAQDYWESLAAQRGKTFIGAIASTQAMGTIIANSSQSQFPAGLLRLSRLQLLNPTTLEPVRDIVPLRRTGGQAGYSGWPMYIISATTSAGPPTHYWTNGSFIFWSPITTGSHSVRWYGFMAAPDITAAGVFSYPDIVALPIATFANRMIKSGLDDNVSDLSALAVESFNQTLDALSNMQRDGASGLEYTQVHDT